VSYRFESIPSMGRVLRAVASQAALARGVMPAAAREAMRGEREALAERHNRAVDGSVVIDAEYLLVYESREPNR
jgi:hypothetical protein